MSLPIVHHPDYTSPLPPDHRFPMPKFGKVYEYLVRNGIAGLHQFHCPERPPQAWLELAHARDYVEAYCTGTLDARAMRRIGFPWSPALANRTCMAVGGTILAAQLALESGLACNTAGGTHHAFRDFGSGFCIFNDLAVAARVMQQQGLAQRILIIDLDVHQGDGTAAIFQDDPTVFTFSMHCDHNFPFHKQQSDLDAPLPIGMENEAYLATLATYVPDLLTQVKPDLVFYDGGVDPHVDDLLGKLALTDEGLYMRDRMVLEACIQGGYPVACVIGGGYQKDIDRLAQCHCIVHRAASDLFQIYKL
ncbi:MAG: histone deacetylase [Caldilineaceae bacterium]